MQLRGKDLGGKEMLEIAEMIRKATLNTGTLFVVNDRIDVALLSGADGVHVGQSDLPARAARAMLGPDAIIGVSTATVEESIEAEAEGADYLGVGPIFPTGTKADAGEAIGLAAITAIKRAVRIPVVAIGGISLANIADVARAGADSAAVISAVVCSDDMARATRELANEFERGRTESPWRKDG